MDRKNKLVLEIILLSFIIALPALGRAAWSDAVKMFHPSLTLQEEYTDNLDLRDTNTREDWITTIYPGIRFSTQREVEPQLGKFSQTQTRDEAGIDLRYLLGLVFYGRGTYDDYISHNGALDAWYTIAHRLNVRLRDSFIKSEEPREPQYALGAPPGSYLPGTQRQRAKYYRNVLEPSMEYRYGRENRLSLYYRNNIYDNESPQYEDSRENYINPRIEHWFNIHNGITLEYGYTNGDFERSPDLQGHMARGRYTYRFSPRTSIFGDYVFLKRDFEDPGDDYDVQNPSIGITHAFSSSTNGNFQVGYFWQNAESGANQYGISLDAGLITRLIRTTYSLFLRAGPREDYFSAENLGFSRYYGAYGSIAHRLAQRFEVGLSGFVERDEYTIGDRNDWLWEGKGSLSYQPLRWLIFTLEALHREDDSNIEGADYKENRGILRITASL